MTAGEEKSEQNTQESNLRPQMDGESSACNSIASVPSMCVTSATALGAESHLSRKNFLEFQTEIHNLMQQQYRKQTSKCHQLKIYPENGKMTLPKSFVISTNAKHNHL